VNNSRVSALSHPDVLVAGAGAFGGWTALELVRHGAKVALLDPWSPGHPRGTSSGETRVIRCSYGQREIYLRWARRSWKLWQQWERRWRVPIVTRCGVLWLLEDEAFFRPRLGTLRAHHIPCEFLSARELRRRYPQFRLRDITCGYLESEAGFLRARLATQLVAQEFLSQGDRGARARLLTAAALPPAGSGSRLQKISLSDGSAISAGSFVFACGPWLPRLFPELLARRIRVTRQEEFFFGTPAGDARFAADQMPVWIEPGSDFYGIPVGGHTALKVADDRSGPPFDPTSGNRSVSAAKLHSVRNYLARRLPELARAPLVESRVCQYERTPDAHLVVDRHAQYENVWIAGGGSGHGFKLGPALGEVVAQMVLGGERPRRSASRKADDRVPEMLLDGALWPASGPAPKPTSY